MKSRFLDREFLYDGSQLTSLFAYLNFEILGDSIVAWQGPCNVSPEKMVDGEDLLAKQEIRGDKMLHFIAELFDDSLYSAVLAQRLLSALAFETILAQRPEVAASLCRRGDDIYFNDGKLSISIATKSPTSNLIHFAMNIVNDGTPVKTASLHDLNIDPKGLAERLLQKFSAEIRSSREARCKVRWVK